MCYIDYNANSSCKSGQPQLLPPCVLQLNEENWARQRVLNFISGKICFLTITKGWDLKQASRRWILISHGITSSLLHIYTHGSWQRPPNRVQSLGATQKHPSTSLCSLLLGLPIPKQHEGRRRCFPRVQLVPAPLQPSCLHQQGNSQHCCSASSAVHGSPQQAVALSTLFRAV